MQAVAADAQRIESLQRLLNDAASRGSMRDVVCAFAEALSVWHDVDVWGYVAGARGGFFQDVVIVGVDPSAAPGTLDVAVPAAAATVRLSRAEAKTLGFASEGPDVRIVPVAAGRGAAWLMVCAGNADPDIGAALAADAELLRATLSDLARAATASLVSAIARIPQQLERAREPADGQAQLALNEVMAAVRAVDGALVVVGPAGARALAVGHPGLLPPFGQGAPPDRLVVTAAVADHGGSLSIVVAREDGRFTAHERSLLEDAAALTASWVSSTATASDALDRSGRGERRAGRLPVDQLIERLATEAVQTGSAASLMVMSIPDGSLPPGLMHAWAARVKGQLRPLDFAGVISGREIAVLLRDIPADRALGVSNRLKGLLESVQTTDGSIEPSVGLVACAPGVPISGSLVNAARDNAAR